MNDKTKNIIKDISSYVIVILIVIIIRVFIFDPVRVDGPSMDTTLAPTDEVITATLFLCPNYC